MSFIGAVLSAISTGSVGGQPIVAGSLVRSYGSAMLGTRLTDYSQESSDNARGIVALKLLVMMPIWSGTINELWATL
jgi:hypothetical protein